MQIKLPKNYFLKSSSTCWRLGKYSRDKDGEIMFTAQKYFITLRAALKEFVELGVMESENYKEARELLEEVQEIKKDIETSLDLKASIDL